MVDKHGFRLNVGIILSNPSGHVFWGRRVGQHDAWQFPQGGIHHNETPQQAMYRELYEEIGLEPPHVKLLAESKNWLSYHLPKHLLRPQQKPFCIGQKQKWFLLRLVGDETAICFDRTQKPEFSSWCWVDYWHPVEQVIPFKKQVYKNALEEFALLI